jgi:site-specific DNA recombinase
MTKHTAIYARLSPRPDGSYEGVDVQERQGRKYAAQHWPGVPVVVYADPGISAANGDHRPRYEALRAAVAAGHVAHVWVVEQSRLERREVQWFELAAELDAAGITEVHTDRDGIVRVRDEVAGIKAVLAASEVRKLKARVNAKLSDNAGQGQPPGVRPFGYAHATVNGVKTYRQVPEQAAAIRDAAAMVLRGWSLAHVAAELRARGVRGAHGAEVSWQTVRRWLISPTIAGQRVHRGVIVGPGNWAPILDAATWQACRRKLAGQRMVQRHDGNGEHAVSSTRRTTTARRYLLTGGVARCGICGAELTASETTRRGKRFALYECRPTKGGRNCVAIKGEALESYVRDELLAQLDTPEFLAMIADGDPYEDERQRLAAALSELESRRGELARMWAQPGVMTTAEWHSARDGLAEQGQRLHVELAELPPAIGPAIDIATVRATWNTSMTLGERREIVSLFVERVTIGRATLGRRGFDAGRVTITWRRP